MSQRTAVWQIAADFSRARRESDRTARSLKRLNRERETFVDDSLEGDEDLIDSHKRHGKSVASRIASLGRLARAQRSQSDQTRASQRVEESAIRTSDEATAATQRQEAAHRDAESTLRRLIRSRRDHATAQREEAAQTAEVIRAQENLKKATLSNEKAALSLESAQRRLATAQKQHGASSEQYANALLSVQRRQNEAASSAHRLAQATNTLHAAQTQAAGGSGGLGHKIGGLAGKFFNGANAAKLFGIALMGVKFGALLSGLGAAAAGVSNLAAGLIALIGPLASVGNSLAALPAFLATAVGGIGTFIGAFSGVGEALKAGMEAQKNLQAETKETAKVERDSARQIADAQRAVRDARRNAADTAKRSAETIRSANRNVVYAEEALADATEAVTEARRQARQELEDYKESLSDLERSERGAALSVEEARRRLNETLIDPGADSLAKAQAQLAYDEALDRLGDVRREKKKTEEEAKKARSKGVNGNDGVVAALEAERDAQMQLVEAQRQVSEARREASRAAEDSARAIRDAQENLADAYESTSEAMENAAKTQNEYQEALAGLSPEAAAFVRLLIGMQGEVKRLRDAAARGLLPGLGSSLVILTKLLPLLEDGLFRFGKVIGNVAVQFARLLTRGDVVAMMERILDANVKLLRIGGRAFLNIVEALLNITDAARPFTNWLARTVEGWTEMWAAAAGEGNRSGKTRKALRGTREVLEVVGRSLRNIWRWFRAVGDAGGDALGMDLLRGMESITEEWDKWARSPVGKGELKEWFETSGDVLHETSELLGAITRGLFDLGRENNIAPLIKQMREDLGPEIMRLLEAFQGEFATDMLDAIVQIVELLADAAEGGGLGTFWKIVGGMADFLNDLPTGVLNTFVAALGTLAALKFTGVLGLMKVLGKGGGKAFNFTVGEGGQKRRARRAERKQARAVSRSAEAGSTTFLGGSGGDEKKRRRGGARKAPKPRMRDRFRSRMAGRNEGGFVSMGGGRPRGGARKAAPDATPKSMEKTTRSAKKMGKAVGKSAGVLGTLTMALGFLPGPIGDAAAKFSDFAMVLMLAGPLIGTLGGWFAKLGGWVMKAVVTVGKWMFKIIPIVGRVLGVVMRLFMANPWMLLITALIIVVTLVVKHWDKIKKFISKAINGIINWIKDNWDIIKWFLGPIVWLIDAVVRNWDKIKAAFMKAVDALISAFKKTWEGIKAVFSVVWDWVKRKATEWWNALKTNFQRGADAVKSVFTRLKDGIKTIWDKIKSVVSKPVEFVVNTILNKGLIAGYNKIAGFLGMKEIGEIQFSSSSPSGAGGSGGSGGGGRMLKYAKGGIPSARDLSVYPGYTPGRDVGVIGISGGEAIMRPEWTRAIGSKQIEEWNATARRGGVGALRKRFMGNFASGGIPAVGSWNRHTSGYSFARWAGDINVPGSGDYGNPVKAYKDGTVATAIDIGDQSYGRYIIINHAGGEQSLYAHLSRMAVSPGQTVKRGQHIGNVGDYGNSFGPHLHFEIRGGNSPIQEGSGGGTAPASLPKWLSKIVSNVGGWVKGKINSGVDLLQDKFGGSPFVKMLTEVPRKFANGLIDKITGMTSSIPLEGGDRLKDIGAGVANAASLPVQAMVRAVAMNYGWGDGRQWEALAEIIRRESGWDPNAANPTSSARGLFQKMTSIHGPVEPTVEGQAKWGLNYIKGRYGTPLDALAFWNARGYYADGGVVPGVASPAPVQAFARGGRVRGYGNRDTVPAMLTPGEFVIKKDAVERVGVQNLETLNRGKRNRGKASGTQFFHRGGAVLGMREGARGAWVKALEMLVGQKKVDGTWDGRLSNLLRREGSSLYGKNHVPSVDMAPAKDKRLLEWLRGPKSKKGEPGPSWGAALKRWNLSPRALFGWLDGIIGKVRALPKSRTRGILEGYSRLAKRFRNPEYKALNERLGLRNTSSFTRDSQKALTHALSHTFKRPHDDFAYRPWKNWTPLEASIIQADMRNEKVQQWQSAMEQIATWGFDSLLEDMLSKGMDDDGAFRTALEASKNRHLAKTLNDKLALLGNFSDEDFKNLLRMVGLFNSSATAPGLRDMARHLGMSDYETVMLYEKSLKAGRLDNVNRAKRSRIDSDIRSYRSGTFYFNEGGSVPGGGNRDSVPAMLTPGEFVLKKEAAKALGLRNLWALNNPQKFARGGLVMAPDVSRPPTISTTGVSAHRLSAAASGSVVNNVTYDVDIHNPIHEKSTRSLTKALQRQSTIRTAGGSGWKSVG